MTQTLSQEARRDKIRREFSAWRKKEKLSYQKIANEINRIAGVDIAMHPTVTSWGVRGQVPRLALAGALRKAYPSCPLLKYV